MPSGGRRVQLGDKCKNCGIEITKFNAAYKTSKFNAYLQARCKCCFRAKPDAAPSRTKEARSKQYVNWKWGLTPAEYNRRVELQLNGCAICKQPCDVRSRLAVDHNHKTDEIRDLLCHRCNMVLGLVKEDEGLLFDMIDYLKRHNQKQIS